jgi:hypothetical protein
MTNRVDRRSVVRNVILRDCTVQGCFVDTAVLEHVTVDGLKTIGLFQLFGAVCSQVTLKGRIGRIMFSPQIDVGRAPKETQEAFRQANAAYYRRVNWAIDIRDADAEELELTGIPGALVKRNAENSILVKAANLKDPNWRTGIENTAVEVGIQRILDYQLDDVVVVACRRSKDYESELELFETLRERGVAEPD